MQGELRLTGGRGKRTRRTGYWLPTLGVGGPNGLFRFCWSPEDTRIMFLRCVAAKLDQTLPSLPRSDTS
jgi:hypothetical protein